MPILVGSQAAALLRLVYHLLPPQVKIFLLLFVDDLWSALPLEVFWDLAARILIILCALGAPIKWSKSKFGVDVMWVGFVINFVAGTLGVDDARAIYICNKLDELRRAESTCAKELLEIADRLIWITGLWDLLRPLVQPFYAAAYGMRRRSRYKPPALIRFACKYFVSQISTAPRRVAAKQRQLLNIWAASDGSASPPTPSAGSSATVGGWFGPVGCSKSEVTWFSEPLEKKDAPWLYSRGRTRSAASQALR